MTSGQIKNIYRNEHFCFYMVHIHVLKHICKCKYGIEYTCIFENLIFKPTGMNWKLMCLKISFQIVYLKKLHRCLHSNEKDTEKGHLPFLLTAEFRNPNPVTMAT